MTRGSSTPGDSAESKDQCYGVPKPRVNIDFQRRWTKRSDIVVLRNLEYRLLNRLALVEAASLNRKLVALRFRFLLAAFTLIYRPSRFRRAVSSRTRSNTQA